MKRTANLVFASIIILTLCFATFLFLAHRNDEARKFADAEQEQALRTFWQLLLDKGSEFRVVDGRLQAGDYVINGNCELPDKIRAIFGVTATIFMGDTRVATNVLKADGSRAIGTKLTGPAYDAVFRENSPYRGEAPIFGIPHITAYDPIRDKNGTIIGVLYVGKKKSDYFAAYDHLKFEIISWTATVAAMFIALFFVLLLERKRHESALQSQLDFLQVLIDTIPNPVFYKDRAGRYLGCNRAFESCLGTPRDRLVGKTVYDLAPSDLADKYFEMDEALFNNPGTQVYESSVVFTDGIRHDVMFSKGTYAAADGTLGGLVGVILDVSDLKNAEDILAQREEFLTNIIDSIQECISILDADLRIVRVNPIIERQFADGTPFVGRKCHEVYHGRAERCEQCPSIKTLETGKPSFKIFSMEKNGTESWLELHTFPLFDSMKSRITGVIEYVRDVTERKNAEEALMAAERKFRCLVEQSLVGTYIIQDGTFSYANPKLAEIFGYTQEEITAGMSPLDLTVKTDHALVLENFRKRAAGEVQGIYYEFRGVRKGGTLVDIEVYGSSVEYNGRPAIIGTLLDVTERKQAERLLAAEKQVVEMINGEAPLPAVLNELCRIVEERSPGALCSLLLLHDDGRHLCHAAAPTLPEAYCRAIDGTRIGPNVGSCGTAAHTRRDVFVSDIATDPLWEKYRDLPLSFGLRACWSKPILASNGAVLGTFSIYHTSPHMPDAPQIHLVERMAHLASIVIERKRAEKALRESEERFHQIFAQNGDAIILFRAGDYAIIDANRAAEELTGFTLDALVTLTPSAIIAREDFDALMNSVPIDDRSLVFQLDKGVCVRRDASTIFVSVRCKIITLGDKLVVYCSIRDITKRVRMEEEIKTTQAKLIQTNKMTSLGMLASSIAHEINNPNNYISLNASLLAEAWRDALPILKSYHADYGEFSLGGLPYSEMERLAPRLLTGITEGSRRITDIVNNMKDFVRADMGKHGTVDVNRTVRDAATILWSQIQRYTDSFRLNLADDLPPARGNARQIEQVLINLVMNALQALPNKECDVRVTTSLDAGSGSLVITVTDNGRGMDADVLASITEPFFSTRIEEGGTGLGLYISASIVKEHNGSLDFTSAPGQGTTATILLPTVHDSF